LVRDEHAMIVDYLKSQATAEKARHTDETTSNRATEPAPDGAGRIAVAMGPPKAAAPRARAPAMTASSPVPQHPPLVLAQAEQNDGTAPAAPPADRLARDPDSLLAKTLDLKDHVVATTRHVVWMIGDVFVSVGERVGERFGGPSPDAPAGRQFSS
jgi:hypothetical protein